MLHFYILYSDCLATCRWTTQKCRWVDTWRTARNYYWRKSRIMFKSVILWNPILFCFAAIRLPISNLQPLQANVLFVECILKSLWVRDLSLKSIWILKLPKRLTSKFEHDIYFWVTLICFCSFIWEKSWFFINNAVDFQQLSFFAFGSTQQSTSSVYHGCSHQYLSHF